MNVIQLKSHIKNTETPDKPCQIVHMDIWFYRKDKFYLTLIDKFFKYAQVIPIRSRNWIDLENGLIEYIGIAGKPQKIVTDNERGFDSLNLRNFFKNENIQIHFTTLGLHTENSDIERFHNTLNEHIRLLKVQETLNKCPNEEDLVSLALKYYNHTYHSSTGQKPISFHNGKILHEEYAKIYEKQKLFKENRIKYHNKSRKEVNLNPKYIKNPQRNNKLDPINKSKVLTPHNDTHYKDPRNKFIYKSQLSRKKKYQ